MTLATSLVVLFNCYATADVLTKLLQQCFLFLAHLSRRLIGEFVVYKGISRPSVRPSASVVRLSTFSNDISSEADSFHISHIASIGKGERKVVFFIPIG